jgi:heparin/heparan-sulfate lyase
VPAALVVFDRVVSADPAFRKFWLLHTLEEPQVAGATATVDRTEHGERGRLNLDVLLPAGANADLAKVGGPGREYWVFGQNWANDVPPDRLAKSSKETGAWRLELSPRQAAAEDLFLTVLQTTDRQSPARRPVCRLDAGERTGCVLEAPDAAWVVLLRRDSQRSAAPVQFTVPGAGAVRVLVTDLAPGRWQAREAARTEAQTLEVSAESGAAWFEGRAGPWTLTRTAAD